ncbi:MAG: peptidoglycan DD-metalloendopeptidase family protein [Pacificimonas sp.]
MYRDSTLDDLNIFTPAAAAKRKRNVIVDLGDDIGSGSWWRGLLTLIGLLTFAFWLAMTPSRLPAYASAPKSDTQLAALRAVSISPLMENGRTGARMAPTALVKPLAETPERPRIEVVAELREVDSFSAALRRAGVGMNDVSTAALLISDYADVTGLKPGTTFDLVLGRRTDKTQPRPLDGLGFRAAFDLQMEVARNDVGDLYARPVPIRIDDSPLRVTGLVGDSLYKSAREAGLPSRVVANFIKALSPRVNFQRNVMASDEFDVVVAHRRAETGETETGELLYARLDGNDKDLEIAAWEKDGKTQYFLPDGKGVKEGMALDPVRGARMSSRFGMRRHPVLKRTRMHKGIDFAARSGTPIEATAAGTVVFAGRNGGYGNQVRIRHKNGIVTSYSHMKSFGSGIRSGASVAQGQSIGYVGSTGMSTGPHLHYEVHVAGRAVDPRSQKLPVGVELTGGELQRFKEKLAQLRSVSPISTSDDEEAETRKS